MDAQDDNLHDVDLENEKQSLIDPNDSRSAANTLKRLWRTDWFPWIPARYVLAIMGCLGFVNVYILRVNLSMALVVMVNNTQNVTLHNVSC